MTTQIEAMNHAIDVLKDSQDYKMGRAMTVEAVEALEEALAKQKGQSNFCPQCEALARELKASKQEQGEQWHKSQQALEKKADNARELGLDYEPKNTLHWHALNYRTASIQNAQAMFEALEKFVAKQEQGEPVMGVEVKRVASGGFTGNVWWIHENLQEGVFHLYTTQRSCNDKG